MKPPLHRIILNPNESFTCCAWHLTSQQMRWKSKYHSDYIMTLGIHGRGMRFVGDSVERFRENDLVLLGPNLPQSWWSDDVPKENYHISSSFSEDFLGAEFMALPEIAPIRHLLSQAGRGLAFPVSVCKELTPDIIAMSERTGCERLCLLLSILNRLAMAKGTRPLASRGFSLALDEHEAGRLTAVCKYIQESYEGKIQRNRAATLVGLSPDAFSRFFHKRMGRTFMTYVMEVRVGQACHKLVEGDSTIAQIAFETGFNNLSNFNHHFRMLQKMSPREYRQLHADKILRLGTPSPAKKKPISATARKK